MNLKVISLMRHALSLAYTVFKLLPQNGHKVVFLSRQSDTVPPDFAMLASRLTAQDPQTRIVFRCRRFGSTPRWQAAYILQILGDAWHLATARVAVLDSYSIAVSVLKHRPSLYVIQLWHAMGKIKRSGYANLGMPYGRSAALAQALSMHANNDLVVAGGEAWNRFYRESFGPGHYQLLNVGLPRLDRLLTDGGIRQRLLDAYPVLTQKTVILYAPTWRPSGQSGADELLRQVDSDTYALIVREHWKTGHDARETVISPDVPTVDLLTVCDYLVTDYSAIAVEAAALRVKTLYYVFDYDDYANNNGLNIDLFAEMPGCVFKDAAELMAALKSGRYDDATLERYRAKYLPSQPGHATEAICTVILDHLRDG